MPDPLPKRLLYVERLRRRMRVRFGGTWIADSENALVLFEPGRYPVAYFPEADVALHTLQRTEHTSRHGTTTSGSRPGSFGRASGARREEHGNTLTCPLTHANCRHASRSLGRPWTRSMKKTNGS